MAMALSIDGRIVDNLSDAKLPHCSLEPIIVPAWIPHKEQYRQVSLVG